MDFKLNNLLFYIAIISFVTMISGCSLWNQYFSNTTNTNEINSNTNHQNNATVKTPTAIPTAKLSTFLLYASFYSFQAAKEAYRILHQHYPDEKVFIRRLDISQSTEEPQLIYQILIGPIHSQEEADRLTENIPTWLPYQPKLVKIKIIYH
ncbi:hypothetical protein L3V82_07585 [Thiotrichales bacterium 19S3-7]|nr:hypothetical protein [Thiotrichales bacterium 19S3-7]MCF6802019.1 hypothetical protein [Thiotrichales bacterium 19S3-11]